MIVQFPLNFQHFFCEELQDCPNSGNSKGFGKEANLENISFSCGAQINAAEEVL
jgi:hypothetical protein